MGLTASPSQSGGYQHLIDLLHVLFGHGLQSCAAVMFDIDRGQPATLITPCRNIIICFVNKDSRLSYIFLFFLKKNKGDCWLNSRRISFSICCCVSST